MSFWTEMMNRFDSHSGILYKGNLYTVLVEVDLEEADCIISG